MGTTLRCVCIKNVSSYSISLFVDGEAYRQIGHDSNDKCECVLQGGKRGASIQGRRSCKVERRKWENVAGVPVTMKEELLSDGCKRDQERKRDRSSARSAIIISFVPLYWRWSH